MGEFKPEKPALAITLVSSVGRELAVVAHSYSLSAWEAEKGMLPDVQSQPELHRNLQVSLGYICENLCQEKERTNLLSGKKRSV